jgi:hypothetical protein
MCILLSKVEAGLLRVQALLAYAADLLRTACMYVCIMYVCTYVRMYVRTYGVACVCRQTC